MGDTFATRLAEERGFMRFFFTLQGVEDVFSEASQLPSGVIGARAVRPLISKVDQGESQVDMVRRRMTGGTLSLELVDDVEDTLRTLIQPMRRPVTTLTLSVDAVDATMLVGSTANMPSAGAAYIEAETFEYTSKDATHLYGCTRGLYGSNAAPHVGFQNGQGIFLAPPAWQGRRIYLWGAFFNDDGATTTALCRRLGVWRLDSAPAYQGDGRWTITASELCDDIATRKAYVGFRDAIPAVATTLINDAPSGEWHQSVDMGDDNDEFFPVNTVPSSGTPLLAVILKGQGGRNSDGTTREGNTSAVARYYGKDITFPSHRHIFFSRFPFTTANPESAIPLQLESARLCAVLTGSLGRRVLNVLCSRLGDGANGNYDILPGSTVNDIITWRMGANIDETDVDSEAFIEVGAAVSPTAWSYLLSDEVTVGDLLGEFCRITDSFWLVDSDGLLTVKRMRSEIGSGVDTIDDPVSGTVAQITYDESAITPLLTLKLNYDPLVGEFMSTMRIIDTDIAGRYPTRQDAVEVESRFLSLAITEPGALYAPPNARAFTDIETMTRRMQVASARGDLYATTTCTLDKMLVGLGDVVALSDALSVDMQGGTLSGRVARVIGKRPNYDEQTIELRLHVLEPLRVVAPAARISSIVSTTINLNTSSDVNYGGASNKPGRQFRVGWSVWVCNTSSGARAVRTVTAIADGSITVNSAPGVAGADHVTVYQRDLDTSTGNADIVPLGHSDFAYLEPDGAIDDASRWR